MNSQTNPDVGESKVSQIVLQFEVEDLYELRIAGEFTVNGQPYNKLTLAGLKKLIEEGFIDA